MRTFLPIALLCAAALVAGCQPTTPDPAGTSSTPAGPESAPPEASPAPQAPASPATSVEPAPAATVATPQPGEPEPLPSLPTAEQDTCGASTYAVYMGQEYERVPAAPPGKVVRVVCSTCPMTMDFNAQRLNVIYDEKTSLVTRLSCG